MLEPEQNVLCCKLWQFANPAPSLTQPGSALVGTCLCFESDGQTCAEHFDAIMDNTIFMLMIYHRSNNRETPSWRLGSESGSV